MNGCREFQGTRDAAGYGRPMIGPARIDKLGRKRGRHQVRLHRWVMEQYLGRSLNPDELVLHACDNPPCFFIEHLRVGTGLENAKDAQERDRLPTGERHWQARMPERHARGEARPEALLTEADVLSIRRRYQPWVVTQAMLAAEFGVARTTISAVLNGRTWAHLWQQDDCAAGRVRPRALP